MDENQFNLFAVSLLLNLEPSAVMRELRRYVGVSQQEMATRIGVSLSSYANWEVGRVAPTSKSLVSAIRLAHLVSLERGDEED
ncbi:helix-turn-helix transcriptional regulator [Alicyclobacillus fodiniaquatilis]|uniref:Helix-turn-helix transcriptional regulator n=1 Tax=Alicyclobacillus fodiniaquatilis TaxID=1661150 RepID=A0ABW4JD27_9BACL